jgi:SnoaL-like domain
MRAAALLLLAACAAAPRAPIDEADATLDALHAAAARADGPAYFALFAPRAWFIGTDATENWDLAAFRAYAEPLFAAGTGWTYEPIERHVSLSDCGDVAWFIERLRNSKYGETRGSGVLVRDGGRWLIAQYVLSFPVPNELAPELVQRIRDAER